MKRSGPLKRNTPLQSRSVLKRSAGSKADFSSEVRDAVLRRSGGRCEASTGQCWKKASHIHHIRRRKCGDNSLGNALHVCVACHNWIHANVAQAEEKGWLIRCN